MSRFLRFALVSIVPFTLWGYGLIQSARVSPASAAQLDRVEREGVEPYDGPPALGTSERVRASFPRAPSLSGHILNRVVHDDMAPWPELKRLGETVTLDGSEVTVSDYRIVRGGVIPMAYLPETGEMFDAPDGGRAWNRWGSPAVVIPPGASLVITKVDVVPSVLWENDCKNPWTGEKTRLEDRYFYLAYPGLGDISPLRTFVPGQVGFGPYSQPQLDCFGNGWYYFFLASLDPDPSGAWLTYSDPSDPDLQGFWALAEWP